MTAYIKTAYKIILAALKYAAKYGGQGGIRTLERV